MDAVVISGSGLYTPEAVITNDELVESYNRWVEVFNQRHAAQITAGELSAKQPTSAAFIEKVSGIRQRYVLEKAGILDIERMRPRFEVRDPAQPSLQAEMGIAAAKQALQQADRTPQEVDLVIASCTCMERDYPAIAIEIQHHLGCSGFAYDMNLACSSVTFALHTALAYIRSGMAERVLVVSPEQSSAQVDFTDHDSHFIFGDAGTAMLLEKAETARGGHGFEVIGSRAESLYSNNIRNDFGILNRCQESLDPRTVYFHQQGTRVFKEVCPMAIEHIRTHLEQHGHKAEDLSRLWMHQANRNMNQLIARKLFGGPADPELAPMVLEEYANTGCNGSAVAFHLHHAQMQPGDLGMICSFGAGYSIGSLLLRRC